MEILEAVGEDNCLLFGRSAEEVGQLKASGDRELFKPLVESLLNHGNYLLLEDFQPYVDCQTRISDCYRDQESETRMSILNSAGAGRCSSDRSIREYCRDIWNVEPITTGPGHQ